MEVDVEGKEEVSWNKIFILPRMPNRHVNAGDGDGKDTLQ